MGALLAASIATGVVTGRGGDGPPDGAVAKVGDSVITKADFERQAGETGSPAPRALRRALDPPDFSECVAALRMQTPEETPGEDLKRECKQQFDQVKGRVMNALLIDEWIRQEARTRGISVTGDAVKRALRSVLEDAGVSKDAALRRYMRHPDRSRGSTYNRVRADVLHAELTDRIARRAPTVTDVDVERYFERHEDRFVLPERRDLRVVLTRTRSEAEGAKTALGRGRSWAAVAKRHSIDPASKTRGGRLAGVESGELEKELDAAVFRSSIGRVEGPVSTQFGWYVFEVTAMHRPTRRSLEQARREIRDRLSAQRRARAVDSFNEGVDRRYEPRTVCADEYKVPACGNA